MERQNSEDYNHDEISVLGRIVQKWEQNFFKRTNQESYQFILIKKQAQTEQTTTLDEVNNRNYNRENSKQQKQPH